jgi:hypothetical protein
MFGLTLPGIDIRDFISVTSLSISLLTAYWNILRGAKYVSPPLRWVVFGLLPGSNTLVINFPVAVTNTGSSTGVIDSFYIDLTNLSTRKVERFYAWQEGKLIGQEFKGFGIEMPTPVSLKAGESVVKYYTFFPDSLNFMYTVGVYRISLHAYLSGGKRSFKLYEQKLEIESMLQPSPYQNAMPIIFSYNLLPKKMLKVSNYGNDASAASMIEIAKR